MAEENREQEAGFLLSSWFMDLDIRLDFMVKI